MTFSNIPFTTSCIVLALTLSLSYQAQGSPEDYLDGHNAARAAVGVEPISWDPDLAAYAENYASQRKGDCEGVHSGGPYGENIAWGGGDMFGTDAVTMWVGEKPDYSYDSNSCAPGRECGHYTQVVWRKSVHVGCAKVRCDNGGAFIICSYSPPGNYEGERPY